MRFAVLPAKNSILEFLIRKKMKFLNYIFVLLLISAELSAQIYIGSRGNVGGAPQLLVSGRVVQSDGDGTVSDSAVAVSDVARLSQANVFALDQSISGAISGVLGLTITNTNAQSTTRALVSIRNGGSGTEVILRANGTGFTTSGAQVQDGASLVTGANLSGGLSIASTAGDMRFYNGGTADANLLGGLFGSSWCLGPENAACSGTLEIEDPRAVTGSTNVKITAGPGQTGNLLQIFAADGTTNRLSVSAAGVLTISGSLTASGGNVTAAANGFLTFSGRTQIASAADGVLQLRNTAGTDFNLLQFGGTTSSFPALKRFGNAVAHRAADDTIPTFATLTACAAGGEGATTPVSDSSTATWGATITGGGANRVLAYCNGTNWTVSGI